MSYSDFVKKIVDNGGSIADIEDATGVDREEAERLWKKYRKSYKHYFRVMDYADIRKVDDLVYSKDRKHIIDWLLRAGKALAQDVLNDCGVGSEITIERNFNNSSTWKKVDKNTWSKGNFKMSEKELKERILDYVILSGFEVEGEYDFYSKCSVDGVNTNKVLDK